MIKNQSHFVSRHKNSTFEVQIFEYPMKVATTQPFQIIYSLLEHQYLGYLFEAFVVQVNTKGELTLQNQLISSTNIQEFSARLDEKDVELVKLIDAIQQDAILKKFNSRKISSTDFFLKIFDKEKGEKLLQETILGYVEKLRSQILLLLKTKKIFIMGNDGIPTWKAVEVVQEKAKMYFHFVRNEDNTHYFPNIKCLGEKVDFQYKNAIIICDEPAWLLVNNKLYHFDKNVDGKKLKPFLYKKFIVIPKNIEDTYYHKFIAPLIAQFDVFAKGFDIKTERFETKPILTISEQGVVDKTTNLFDYKEYSSLNDENKIIFDLSFQYKNNIFHFDNFISEANVTVEKKDNNWTFYKIRRDLITEKEKVLYLKSLHLAMQHGRCILPKNEAFSWLQKNAKLLEEANFEVKQPINNLGGKRYFLGYSSIEIKIVEKQDWFDIQAFVKFGEFEIPFLTLRKLILAKKKEFTLPNNEIAIIPEEWFTRYSELFSFAEKEGIDGFTLRKYHLGLVQNLTAEGLAQSVISRKLENLRNFEEIEQYSLPKTLQATLRPYQKAGYDWLNFLNEYRFGGCLADDMGLGKTLQALAFLQKIHEHSEQPSLVIMPTSLIYNWQKEAEKFTPTLKVFVYTGTNREKNTVVFNDYDLILTSYGIIRIDIDSLKNYRFKYIILDESQAIKNPVAGITKAVMQLNSANRLILTGTPLENSTMDLWSQMTFINPGLLGTQAFFREEYQHAIEKQRDEVKTKKLYSIIKPFMLRRHKSQVATELPEKVESVQYCDMTEEQEHGYEEAKSYYRNLILENFENNGIAKGVPLILLQGLTKLRQLANHPKMVDENYESDSGKYIDVLEKLETIMKEGHKVLIFSQFVKHLTIFRNYFDKNNVNYCYLDGSTTNRQTEVERFQNDDSVQLFLISLKAGGLGLNLTAAEYVFILDPWWNPAIEAQAVDRAHRIGQKNTVFTYKFITRNTVEEKILSLQRGKQQLFNNLITNEENFVKALSRDDILALLS